MNADVKKEWCAKLRSGTYDQGRGQLRLRNEYCCLGVLCDIAAKHGIGYWDEDVFHTKGSEDASVLPPAVCQWAGIGLDPDIGRGTLSAHNDGVGKLEPHSFAEIADLIEAHL